MTDWRDPIHPGEILAEELEEIEMNAAQLAEKLQVAKNRIYQIIDGRRGITADTALRLGKFFAPDRNSGSICRKPMRLMWRGKRRSPNST